MMWSKANEIFAAIEYQDAHHNNVDDNNSKCTQMLMVISVIVAANSDLFEIMRKRKAARNHLIGIVSTHSS